MAELFEVVLDTVPERSIPPILGLITSNCSVVARVDDSEIPTDARSVRSVFLIPPNGDCYIFKAENLKLCGFDLGVTILRISQTSGVFALDFNFLEGDLDSLRHANFIEKLHKYVSDLGKTHGIGTWYAGMEPAEDEETRYFTDYKLGPLIF